MEAGVYIVTGFLESGKTKFMQEMLTDEGFSEGERTLLLVCEEGEEDYDEALLKRCNTVRVNLESVEDMAATRWWSWTKSTARERRADRVQQHMDAASLYSAKKSRNWELAQIITLIDATTFELYLQNMRKFMADGIQEGDLIIFNRCSGDMPKSKWRRAALAMNNTARIFFENTDGSMDDGVADEDLPYDVKADPIVIGDTDFGIFYLDAMEHPDRYDGKRTARAAAPSACRTCPSAAMCSAPRHDLLRGRHRRHRLPLPLPRQSARHQRLDLSHRPRGGLLQPAARSRRHHTARGGNQSRRAARGGARLLHELKSQKNITKVFQNACNFAQTVIKYRQIVEVHKK